MTELKKCPFCGCAVLEISGHNFWSDKTKSFGVNTYGVKCYSCGSQSNQFYDSEEEAAEAWNRRAEE